MTMELTRLPRPFDPERGQDARALVPDLTGEFAALIEGAAGSAPYLFDLTRKEAAWITEALPDPAAALNAEFARLRGGDLAQMKPELRRAKRRVALLVALCDLGGIWDVPAVTGALSDFADLACDLALKSALAPLIRRGKLPGMDGSALEDAGGLTVLAMGKMGAGELNYSSDIDLICLIDETRFDPDDWMEARATFIKAVRTMCATLSDQTADGYVFRSDLRLRPDPAVTPVAMAMEAAERYYESLGRTWERAAYIKARAAAGDIRAGEAFLKTLTPFVWRKHLDFAAIQDAHDMRLAIREHKGLGGPITLPGHHMKLGRGGIREIEFFTQTRQLIAGGRDPGLRVRGTVAGLEALAAKGWVAPDLAARLTDHYHAHRRVEHALQMVQDAQTHELPQTEDGFERLACLLATDPATLKADLEARLSDVHDTTEGFFAPDAPAEPAAETHLTDAQIDRWLTYPALRSPRARALLDDLRPMLETRLGDAARPDEARLALDGFLAGLPAGVQLLSLFKSNPQLIDLVLDIVTTSQDLAAYLSGNAQVLDAVIGGDFFADWPRYDHLLSALETLLKRQGDDYEAKLDATRRWQKEQHFRIGVHMLRGLISAEEAGRHYADLARVVLAALWPHVQTSFAARHGPPPGRGAVILGMGALGAGRLNARSDLDLIVIYDAEGADGSDGKRPLATRPYFARLTQALITALSAPMAEGRLYEVDMRLRPSGNQGPVATSWPAFCDYQTNDAWTWEHLALTRADVVAGPEALAQNIMAFRTEVLARPVNPGDLARDLAEMRGRIAAAKPPAGPLDAKIGPGRAQDIELLAQSGALISANGARDVMGGLDALKSLGVLSSDALGQLGKAYRIYWAVLQGGRLLSEKIVDFDDLAPDGLALILSLTGQSGQSALVSVLEEGQQAAALHIDAALRALQELGA